MELSGNLKNERKPVTCYNTVYNVKNIIRSQKIKYCIIIHLKYLKSSKKSLT